MKWTLPVIVISQFSCTSLWFAGNAVLPDLVQAMHAATGLLAALTNSVQLGFIAGSLAFALLAVSDRYSPSRVFFVCSIIAGLFNLGIAAAAAHPGALLVMRSLTGFFLAGIYPVGMKLASDHFGQGLGKALGLLVGALVVGTAFPHLLRSLLGQLPWRSVIYATSGLSAAGGLAVLAFIRDGPYRMSGPPLALGAFRAVFRNGEFRAAVLGYFGHMWELYTFWAFVPVMLSANAAYHERADLNISLLSFFIIAPGGLACVLSGMLSGRFGTKRLATLFLAASGICCLLSPFFLLAKPAMLAGFLLLWSLVVIADSPLFSTLVAQHAPAASRGSALTLVTCIGFSITILSIGAIGALSGSIGGRYLYLLLAPGPAVGVIALLPNKRRG